MSKEDLLGESQGTLESRSYDLEIRFESFVNALNHLSGRLDRFGPVVALLADAHVADARRYGFFGDRVSRGDG